jgi:hypothetical protein
MEQTAAVAADVAAPMAKTASEQATMATAVTAATRAGGAHAATRAAVGGKLGAGTQRHHENDTVHAVYLLRTEKGTNPRRLKHFPVVATSSPSYHPAIAAQEQGITKCK